MFCVFFTYFQNSHSGPDWTPLVGQFWSTSLMFDTPVLTHVLNVLTNISKLNFTYCFIFY